jgi:hypothetical protein
MDLQVNGSTSAVPMLLKYNYNEPARTVYVL